MRLLAHVPSPFEQYKRRFAALPWLTKTGSACQEPSSRGPARRTLACTVDARWPAAVHGVAGLVQVRDHFVSYKTAAIASLRRVLVSVPEAGPLRWAADSASPARPQLASGLYHHGQVWV